MKRAQSDIALDLSDVADALFKCIRSNAVGDMPMVEGHLLEVEQALNKVKTDLDIMKYPELYGND